MDIRSYITTLTSDAEHPVLKEVLRYTDEEQWEFYKQAFATVSQLLKRLMQADAGKTTFESDYLLRVIKGFSDEIAEQSRQRQILEAILRHAISHYQMEAAKIPQLITLNRDIPALPPTMLVHTRAAIALYSSVKADLEYPAKLESVQLEVGRLATVLFLFEGIPDLASAALVLRNYELYYAGSIIYLTDPYDSTGQKRFVIQLYTALLIQLVKRYENIDYILERASRSSKMTTGYVQKYLAVISKQENFRISVTQLSNYRNIYWTSHYSPVEAKFFLQRFKSMLLPNDIFIRTILNKSQNLREPEISLKADPVNENTRKILHEHKFQLGEDYQQVKHTTKLIQQLIAVLHREVPATTTDADTVQQDNIALSKNKKKPHQTAITRVVNRLKKPEFSNNFYVLLFGAYLINLLKNGGSRKSLLAFTTIRDYVSAPLKYFLSIFADLDLLKMDEEMLTDKLNCVAEIMPPTKRGCLYYFACYIQQLDLVTDFVASNIDIRAESGNVHANVISVQQMEHVLQFISDAGEHYTDAILLLCLGFYNGARRSEAKFIRVSDFELLPTADGTEVLLKVVPTSKRTIKSRAGTRSIPLTVFWPKRWLALLIQKLQLARASGISKSARLFDETVDQHFTVISQLLRSYLCDNSFTYHCLRHSFVCWQYYRLVLQPRLKEGGGADIHCFDHEYFSNEACLLVRQKLGLPAVTRKSMYALCALVGHSEPLVTFDSYLHLKDLYQYFLMSSVLRIKQKALSRLVRRATIDSELLRQFPASAIRFGTPYEKHTLDISPTPGLTQFKTLSLHQLQLHQVVTLPCLQQLEHGLQMLGKIQSDEVTRIEVDEAVLVIDGSWLSTLHIVCVEVQRDYAKPSARLPLIPKIARSKDQLQGDRGISASRKIFEQLLANAQRLLDEQVFDDSSIVQALEAMTGLLIKQQWSIQFTEPATLVSFLKLIKKLLPDRIQVTATIFDPEVAQQQPGEDNMFERWFMALAQFDIKPELSSAELVDEPHYWNNKLSRGLVWLYFVVINDENYKSDSVCFDMTIPSKRSSTVMQFMHFLMVACKTRLLLKDSF